MSIQPAELQSILDFAVESAQLAGAFTLGYFNADLSVETKADDSPVTAADRGAEQLLRRRIEAAFPAHGILGEELGEKRGSQPARWILDPIDGTFSFISGVPLYAVLVGFEWQGEMLVGVIHLPALKETVYAARGLGCRWNGGPARVSQVASLSQARLLHCGAKPLRSGPHAGAFDRLLAACHKDRGWCDAYGYALLATGRAEVVVDPVMAIWDSAALLPVVLEAGGTFTDWDGRTTHQGAGAVATNGRLFEAVLRALRGVQDADGAPHS